MTPEPVDRQVAESWFVRTGVPPPMRETEAEVEVAVKASIPSWVAWVGAAAFVAVVGFVVLILVIVVAVT